MPIYEYKCQDCGTKFEKLVRRSEGSELVCPSCGQKHLQQELSTFAAHSASSSRASDAPRGLTADCAASSTIWRARHVPVAKPCRFSTGRTTGPWVSRAVAETNVKTGLARYSLPGRNR